MATSYSVLGQENPNATTLTALYAVPAATQAIVSTIVIANLNGGAGTYRIAVSPAGAAIADRHYLAYDIAISNGTAHTLTLGITLDATDVIRVYASHADMAFNAFGSEIS